MINFQIKEKKQINQTRDLKSSVCDEYKDNTYEAESHVGQIALGLNE